MKIAVDLSFIRPDHTNGGTESCIKNLIKGWIQLGVIGDFHFFIHEDIYRDYCDIYPECSFIVYRCRGGHKTRTTWFQTFILPQWIRTYEIDVIYYPTYTTGYYRKRSIPAVVNPHDIQFKFYPEYFSFFKRWYLNLGYSHSLRKADVVIAISDYVKGTLEHYYGTECSEKIVTLYDPVDFSQKKEQELNEVKKPYILSVSSIAKHKNMLTLIKAFERVISEIPHQLVIVGCKGSGMDELNDYFKNKKLENRICFTDYVTDSNIEWLYRHADLYVTTSLYEGFGMTPIEAMGRGIPTICSTATSLPEATMGLAEYYEPADDDYELADKILKCLSKDSKALETKQIFINRYDKKHIAEEYYKILISLV